MKNWNQNAPPPQPVRYAPLGVPCVSVGGSEASDSPTLLSEYILCDCGASDLACGELTGRGDLQDADDGQPAYDEHDDAVTGRHGRGVRERLFLPARHTVYVWRVAYREGCLCARARARVCVCVCLCVFAHRATRGGFDYSGLSSSQQVSERSSEGLPVRRAFL
jgi:hypothetical protein